jgi:hypothetical protein
VVVIANRTMPYLCPELLATFNANIIHFSRPACFPCRYLLQQFPDALDGPRGRGGRDDGERQIILDSVNQEEEIGG